MKQVLPREHLPIGNFLLMRRLLSAAVVVALTSLLGGVTSPVAAAENARTQKAPTVSAFAPPCVNALFDRPRRANDVRKNAITKFAQAATRNDQSAAALTIKAADTALWLDQCGKAFYAEPIDMNGTTAAVAASSAQATPNDVFALQSNPGAARTIYLDFTGDTITNTAWNASYNLPTIVVEPFSASAPADTNFTDYERAAIYAAWQVVAEDYAPFDINVTTADLGPAAIDRASPIDAQYGTRVMVTNSGPIQSACGCGGVAYVDSFSNNYQHAYYQPAWAFSAGVGTSGNNLGQVASHEAGHNLGLTHDATVNTNYYTGSGAWAPIMGSSYNRRVTQWSSGEYPGANNTQDDLTLISEHAPVRTDDHPNLAATADTVTEGSPVTGTIETRTDTDAFKFVASGNVGVSAVTETAAFANLDIELRILDANGATVAQVNPPVAADHSVAPSGLDATWTGILPSTPATYTAVIDGVGSGNPAVEGQYSDYGSLGNYTISLDLDPVAPPVTPSTPPTTPTVPTPPTTPEVPQADAVAVFNQTFDGLRPGQPFSAPLVATKNRTPPVWSATTPTPAGLTLSDTGVLSGTPTKGGTYTFTARAAVPFAADTATITVIVTSTPLTFAVSRLPNARVARVYKKAIAVTGGIGRHTWTRTGILPAGITARVSADSTKMTFKGKPKKAGKYKFRLQVKDSTGRTATYKFVLNVKR